MNKKYLFVIFLIFFILLGISLRFLSINKDFSSEEVDFVKVAETINKTGHPIYYQSEQIPLQVALWHPPMYVFILSIITRFSTQEYLIRSLNIISTLITSILIYLICKNVLYKKDGNLVGLLASTLFLINYYVFSSSLIIDIDSLSMLFVFSFIYFILMDYKENKNVYFILAIFSFIFSLANRYPIAILVYLGILSYIITNKDFRLYLKRYIIIGLAASFIFLIFWSFYSLLIEPGTFFNFIRHNLTLGSEQLSSLKIYIFSFILNIAQIIRLFTLSAVLLFLFSLGYFYKKKNLFNRTVMIYTLVIILFFIIIPRPAFGYPRYFMTAMPGLFILVSGFIYENIYKKSKEMTVSKYEFILTALCIILSILLLILFNPQLTLYRNDGLIKSTNLPDFLLNILCILPLFFILLINTKKNKILFLISLLSILLVQSLFFDFKLTMNQSHIQEVGDYIHRNTNSSDTIIAPKAVAYYADRKFYANDYYKPSIENVSFNFMKEYISKSYYNRKMDDSFFWNNNIYGGVYYGGYTKLDDGISKSKYIILNFKLSDKNYEYKLGDFYIYYLNN